MTISENRKEQRIPGVGILFDLNGDFLGVSSDLSFQGIRLIVNNQFPNYSSRCCRFRPVEGDSTLEFLLKIKPKWRRSRNLAYDEIGAEIIQVNQEEQWVKLIKCHLKNKIAIKELSFASEKNISVRYEIAAD